MPFYLDLGMDLQLSLIHIWMPFVAEVLYYGDVPAELLTLGVVGEKN